MGWARDTIKAGFKHGYDKGIERQRKKKEKQKLKDQQPKVQYEEEEL
jgi:hypothetical protein